MSKITRQESKGLSLAKSTIKEEPNLSNQPNIDEENSSFQSNKEKYNMTLTPSRAKRIVGYRTLKYEDLLSRSVDMSKAQEKPVQPSLSKLSNKIDPLAKSKFNSKNNSQSSNKSYLLGSGGEFNRNEFSQLDISIMSSTKRRVGSNGKRHSSRLASRDNHNMSMAASVREEEDEVRENKDLNTTYIQKTEMVGPKKTVRELGLQVVGKRTKINQYVLVTMIGKGGWGKVFLGIDVNTKQKYVSGCHQALKVIDRKDLRGKLTSGQIDEALRREISIMKTLSHPNIVRLLEALEDEASMKIYLVMEYCSKGAVMSADYWKAQRELKNNFLDEELTGASKSRQLNFMQAKKYFIQILNGLNYRRRDSPVHNSRNVVHHDIKPENILVDSNDDAKLSDFGISVKLEENESDQIFNQEWGTKLYLPPEAWSSRRRSQQTLRCTARPWTSGHSDAPSTKWCTASRRSAATSDPPTWARASSTTSTPVSLQSLLPENRSRLRPPCRLRRDSEENARKRLALQDNRRADAPAPLRDQRNQEKPVAV